MTSLSSPLRLFSAVVRRLGTFVCVSAALLFGPPSITSAALLSTSLSLKISSVTGSATNTVTSLEFLNDVTILIESEQVGSLTLFGNFTGHFSYVAVASPATITLVGNATLTNDRGEQLFLAATILETGTDYPRTVNGALTVTGGTGRFAGASGLLTVTGTDEESLTDLFHFKGTLVTRH